MSKLNLKGLRLFKKKNDKTYLKQKDTVDVMELAEETIVEDDDIIIKGQPETGDLVRIKASDFFAKVEDEIGELNSALDTTNKNVSQNASDISELNSALTKYKHILSIQQVSAGTSDSVSASSNIQVTATITRVSSESTVYPFLKCHGWLTPFSASVSGTTLSLTLYNFSGAAHSGNATFYLVEVE